MASQDAALTGAEAPLDGQRDSSGWSASLYNKTASFVYSPSYASPVLDLLAAQPGERIIDIGCGSGELTKDLQLLVEQKAGGVVVGTDFSESMVSIPSAHRINARRSDARASEDRESSTERSETRVRRRRAGSRPP